jgi:hypothetical protein
MSGEPQGGIKARRRVPEFQSVCRVGVPPSRVRIPLGEPEFFAESINYEWRSKEEARRLSGYLERVTQFDSGPRHREFHAGAVGILRMPLPYPCRTTTASAYFSEVTS